MLAIGENFCFLVEGCHCWVEKDLKFFMSTELANSCDRVEIRHVFL